MLAARFFLAAWDHSLHQNRLGVRSPASWRAGFSTRPPTPVPRDNHHPVELPSCVTPSACLLLVWVARSSASPRRVRQSPALSIAGLGMGASKRVREYQPVVHRLRLSASP